MRLFWGDHTVELDRKLSNRCNNYIPEISAKTVAPCMPLKWLLTLLSIQSQLLLDINLKKISFCNIFILHAFCVDIRQKET